MVCKYGGWITREIKTTSNNAPLLQSIFPVSPISLFYSLLLSLNTSTMAM